MKPRRPDAASEARLDQLRAEAAKSARPVASAEHGYYGQPLLKPPVWTWEVPAYMFVGGAAGAAACIGFASRVTGGDRELTRHAQWVAAIGAAVSGPLLIADLGRPERFLAMLRVFKVRSPMSVGAWLLASFGATSSAAIVLRGPLRDLSAALSAVTGLGMATYTGVLLGATAIPLWARHAALLPAHFGASALGSGVAALELLGHRTRALNNLGRAAAAFETAAGFYLERRPETGGLTARLAGAFSGPIPLLIRLLYGRSRRARQAAAVSTLLGSYLTRVAWIEAGKKSAQSSLAYARDDR